MSSWTWSRCGVHGSARADLFPSVAPKFHGKVRSSTASPIAEPVHTTTSAMALVQTNPDAYVIKPAASAPAIDTSDWPLLLKNYSDCMLQLSP